jgi:hypothetical protein
LYFAWVGTSSRIKCSSEHAVTPKAENKTGVGRAIPCAPFINLKDGANGVTRPTLNAVFQLRRSGRACAVDTTEDFSVRFHAVADDTAVAVGTNRRQRMDRALEAIEDVTLSAYDHFKRLVIFVLANFACRHT